MKLYFVIDTIRTRLVAAPLQRSEDPLLDILAHTSSPGSSSSLYKIQLLSNQRSDDMKMRFRVQLSTLEGSALSSEPVIEMLDDA